MLRFLAEDVGKELDLVLDSVLRFAESPSGIDSGESHLDGLEAFYVTRREAGSQAKSIDPLRAGRWYSCGFRF